MTLRRLVVIVCAAGLFGAACGDRGSDGAEEGPATSEGSASISVSAANFAFSPTTVPVEPGAEIELTFTNEDTTQHSFTAEGLGIDLVVQGGDSDTTTFTAPDTGSVDFVCKFHGSMSGTITAGGTGAGGSRSDDSQDMDY